jgi:hypothetical protein
MGDIVRRLLALIPTLALLLALAPHALAGRVSTSQVTFTAPCLDPHGNPTGLTASATPLGDLVTGDGFDPAWQLRRFSVKNPCGTWARIHMIDFNDTQDLPHPHWYVAIGPGVMRVLGQPGLVKMGIWHLGYTNGGLRVPGRDTGPCNWYGWNLSEILPDGHVSPCPS